VTANHRRSVVRLANLNSGDGLEVFLANDCFRPRAVSTEIIRKLAPATATSLILLCTPTRHHLGLRCSVDAMVKGAKLFTEL